MAIATNTARLEVRLPEHVYELIKYAAEIRGVSLSSYVVSTLGADAGDVIQQHRVITMSLDDQRFFVDNLLNPPQANDALRDLATRYAQDVESR